eukprot:TRINITY_DN22143_c0_g1_i1.p1 TRINITY_DN22143_c0_g1~~TRINITY_DN22143_c0_g1_i1.p1  ORF type:complete len:114 (+),score=18.59 TRINITY_DN22143_c0_g1_i1:105-446(+)
MSFMIDCPFDTLFKFIVFLIKFLYQQDVLSGLDLLECTITEVDISCLRMYLAIALMTVLIVCLKDILRPALPALIREEARSPPHPPHHPPPAVPLPMVVFPFPRNINMRIPHF